ncbi:hypothetical protein GIS00_11265 [Nakamurella sp. YIM 132087]|uniref:FlgD Ig-like domain-containing protein n=1 Tax=Nakamurella alba TaxID=2665158 RepID=A0A7K1FK57_9ACTN|nr:hypothetical protein [Nakamurella alba]MTD14525.1 hypothetical protein [Nakamurella alba]
MTNVSDTECVRDLSGPLQVFTVYTAAGARVWSTADCFPGTGTDIREMPAGSSLQYNIRWSGTTSNPGCTADRVYVPGGEYVVKVAVGKLQSTPATLTIN